jgi:hypothetical protein
MLDNQNEKYSTQPLSDEELQQIREVIAKDARWKWLAVTARNTAVYIAAVIGGLTLFWDAISKIIKGIVR